MEMYFKRKLFRQGNSLVVTIPEEVMEMLGLDENTEVRMSVEKDYILIRKNKDEAKP